MSAVAALIFCASAVMANPRDNTTILDDPFDDTGESEHAAHERKTTVNALADNAGETRTGRNRVGARITSDNTLADDDRFYGSVIRSTPVSEDDRYAFTATIGYSVNYGRWTFANDFLYINLFEAPLTAADAAAWDYSDTHFRHNTISAARVVSESAGHSLSLKLGWMYRDGTVQLVNDGDVTTREFFDGALSVMRLDMPFDIFTNYGKISITPGYSRGTRLWGAAVQDGTHYNMLRLHYLADLSFNNINIRSEFDGQYTPHQVFWTEAVFIGGAPGGRAFPFRMIYSDSGFLFKNDITFPVFQNSSNRFLRGFVPGIIADYTMVISNGDMWFPTRRLVYAGPSVSYTHNSFNFNAHYVRTIDREEWNPDRYAVMVRFGLKSDF